MKKQAAALAHPNIAFIKYWGLRDGERKLPTNDSLSMNIGCLSNRFLITTQGGGDSEYLGWYYNYNEDYITDPQVKVHIETFGEWEPCNGL